MSIEIALKSENIIFIQESEAEEPLSLLEEYGESELFKYLIQWYFPGQHIINNYISKGNDDNYVIYSDDSNNTFILSYNTRIGYIGLERVFFEINQEEYNKLPYRWKETNFFNSTNHLNFDYDDLFLIKDENNEAYIFGENKDEIKDYLFQNKHKIEINIESLNFEIKKIDK